MSKHKWNYEVTDIEALEKAFPKAVVTETRKGIARQVITKLLDCGVDIPGIKLVEEAKGTENPTANGAENTPPKQEASAGIAEKPTVPRFIRRKHETATA